MARSQQAQLQSCTNMSLLVFRGTGMLFLLCVMWLCSLLISFFKQAREAERAHFESVLQAFFFYKEHGLSIVKKHESSYQHLPEPHQRLLCHLPAKFEIQKQCIQVIQMSSRYFVRV